MDMNIDRSNEEAELTRTPDLNERYLENDAYTNDSLDIRPPQKVAPYYRHLNFSEGNYCNSKLSHSTPSLRHYRNKDRDVYVTGQHDRRRSRYCRDEEGRHGRYSEHKIKEIRYTEYDERTRRSDSDRKEQVPFRYKRKEKSTYDQGHKDLDEKAKRTINGFDLKTLSHRDNLLNGQKVSPKQQRHEESQNSRSENLSCKRHKRLKRKRSSNRDDKKEKIKVIEWETMKTEQQNSSLSHYSNHSSNHSSRQSSSSSSSGSDKEDGKESCGSTKSDTTSNTSSRSSITIILSESTVSAHSSGSKNSKLNDERLTPPIDNLVNLSESNNLIVKNDTYACAELDPENDEKFEYDMNNLPAYFPAIHGCRSVEEYKYLNRIAEGTYGVVYRYEDKRTKEIVALKKLKMEREKDGFPITSLREINTLLKAQHSNIVTVREIVVGNNMDQIFIVMDYIEHDLKYLIDTMNERNHTFLPEEVKYLMIQFLSAVAHLHDNWILHRDLKTSNLLLNKNGVLKVGDFGLAREYGSPLKKYTSMVVTLWYRAPELLLGAKKYSTPIDMWSVGCIFAEMLRMEPLFPGKSETDQINRIFKELGTPCERVWPGYSELPIVKKTNFSRYLINNISQRFNLSLSHTGLNLLNKFLTYDPAQRITAEDALKHPYFKEAPLPIDAAMFPKYPSRSEGAAKRVTTTPEVNGGGDFKKEAKNEETISGFHMGQREVSRIKVQEGAGFYLRF